MSVKFEKNSVAYNILFHFMHVAEFPYQTLYFLGNDSWVKRVVRNMEKSSYVSILGKAEMRTVRLRKKGVDKGRELFGEELYNYYMDVSENRKFRGEEVRVWRNHRDAEITSFLLQNNVKILPSEKPELKLKGNKNLKFPIRESWYYTSKEVKQLDPDGMSKVSFTRTKGILITPHKVYVLYNTNKSSIQWSQSGEGKIKHLISKVINSNFKGAKRIDIESAIIFGKGYETAEDIYLNPKRRLKNVEFLSFENTFEEIYFNNLEDFGKIQLRLISQINWENRLTEIILPEELRDFEYLNVDAHGYDKVSKKYILLFFGSNVKQLDSFIKSANLFKNRSQFEILCFTWQRSFIEKVKPDHVTVQSFNTNDVLSKFSKKR